MDGKIQSAALRELSNIYAVIIGLLGFQQRTEGSSRECPAHWCPTCVKQNSRSAAHLTPDHSPQSRAQRDMSTMVQVNEERMEKMSAEEIITSTKQVIQGLEALRHENNNILQNLQQTLNGLKEVEEANLVEEKTCLIQKSLEMIELGLSEAQVLEHTAKPSWSPCSSGVRPLASQARGPGFDSRPGQVRAKP
uniref:Uncharacterized protein n=1 Tax=Callorhinchus milii TaxID=7868 RepID=A0A4W3H5V1_CALMI